MTDGPAAAPPGALVVRRIIRASREEIFDMWTRAEKLRRWMRPPRASGASAESDPRVGGRYHIVMHGARDYDHHGEYLVVDRPSTSDARGAGGRGEVQADGARCRRTGRGAGGRGEVQADGARCRRTGRGAGGRGEVQRTGRGAGCSSAGDCR